MIAGLDRAGAAPSPAPATCADALPDEASLSPVYAYLRRPSLVDFRSHLAAVFFVSGCNFRCGFCHNAALLGQPRPGMPWSRLAEACTRFRDNWVDAAVITGGEPTLAGELTALIQFLKGFGWAVKLDTNGSNPDIVRRCLPLVDYVAMDVKAGPSRYAELTGCPDTESIRASVRLIMQEARDYEFRTTLIDPFHDDDQVHEIGSLLNGARRAVLQPFVPKEDLPNPGLRALSRTSPDRLREARDLLRGCAQHVTILGEAGNVGPA